MARKQARWPPLFITFLPYHCTVMTPYQVSSEIYLLLGNHLKYKTIICIKTFFLLRKRNWLASDPAKPSTDYPIWSLKEGCLKTALPPRPVKNNLRQIITSAADTQSAESKKGLWKLLHWECDKGIKMVNFKLGNEIRNVNWSINITRVWDKDILSSSRWSVHFFILHRDWLTPVKFLIN